MKFRVVLPTFPFSECLRDLADCLADGLHRAGHSVSRDGLFLGDYGHCAPLLAITRNGAEPIIEVFLGAHHPAATLPDYPVVIYQTEVPSSSWFTPAYKARLASALAVWEAAPGFVTQEPGRTSIVPPGLVPARGGVHEEQDIDVMFYGSLSPRRVALLTKLHEAGLRPSVHFNVFGTKRDAIIDRSRVVVDIKQGESDPNDNTRLFALDSRGACVLSENDDDPKRALVPWRIVEQVRELLGDESKRAAHVAARRAELKPMDTRAAVAQLEQILRDGQRLRAVSAE